MDRYVGGPPLQWQGGVNRQSQQIDGLIAWFSGQAQGTGMSEYIANYPTTVQNSPATKINSVLGRGVDLNGSSQRINSVDIEDIVSPYTIALWMLLDTLPTNNTTREMINKADSLGGYSFWNDNNGGTYRIGSTTVDAAGGFTATQINYTLPTATPFHLSMTFDGINCRYWFNGQQIGTAQANTRTPAAIGKPIAIGSFGYYTPSGGDLDPNRWTDGAFFDVRIWKRALAAAQIWQLYDPQTRWELYATPEYRRWFVPVVAGTSIPVFQHSYRQRRA